MHLDALRPIDRVVVLTWEKATRSLRSSRSEAVDPGSSFFLAEQAALQGSAAVLRAAGRWEIGRGYHYGILARVTAMDAGELSRAAREADRICADCREAVHGSGPPVDAGQLAEMQDIASQLFTAAYTWLRETRPSLGLTPPPDG